MSNDEMETSFLIFRCKFRSMENVIFLPEPHRRNMSPEGADHSGSEFVRGCQFSTKGILLKSEEQNES